jgi:glycosyltransferase involved in cell wall biosynthesis
MRALVFTTVFPNPAQPLRGLFVRERIRHLARYAEVRVVAPVPWWKSGVRGQGTGVSEQNAGAKGQDDFLTTRVQHPTFFYIPGVFKFLDGLLLFLSALRCVRRLRREFDFDLIDGHFGYPDGFATVLLGWWFGRPVTITLRGSETEHAHSPLKRRLLAWALRRAARVITVSHPLAELARTCGVPAERIEVIANGVDAEQFAPRDQAESRRALGLPASGKLLISVGHLSPRKGFHRVLNVLPALVQDAPDLTFAIIGGMETRNGYETRLHRQVAELGLSSRVIFAGPRSPEEVALWMNAADCLVLASAREGCPNVVWEAMACGRPVVATRVGEVEHIVPDFAGVLCGEHGEDAELERCLRRAMTREWDRNHIRAHAARHTWDEVARRVLEQWNEALEHTSRMRKGRAGPSLTLPARTVAGAKP